MSNLTGDLPEILGLDARRGLVRIPPEIDVPITPRVRALIDTPEFRRLGRISQLGLVSLVYPSAHHRRFEHSLGVYRLALLFLKQLARDSRFAELISRADAERLIVAALLHDIGHWPFCHLIEDLHLPGVVRHEQTAAHYLCDGKLASVLRDEWGIDGREILALLGERSNDTKTRVLQSILSGPIDVDKMDYLMRDSLHAGVPYGRNFDQQRLIGSLCLNEAGDGLALTDKGRTAAEMMVFARYVMFSEVYWHHAVRSATAMLQRAFFELSDSLNLDQLFRLNEDEFITQLRSQTVDGSLRDLIEGLFGLERRLYKRWAQYSCFEQPAIHSLLRRQAYPSLVECSRHLADQLSQALGYAVSPTWVLIDAPPAKLEVQFEVEVYDLKQDCYRPLGTVSPVVRTLAETQFDDHVKRVRVYVHPELAAAVRSLGTADELLKRAIDQTQWPEHR